MRVVQSLAALAMLAGSAAAPLPALAAQPPRIVAQDCRALALSTSPSKIWQTSFYGERRDLWDNRDWYRASPCFASLSACKAWLYWAQSDFPERNTFRPCRKG